MKAIRIFGRYTMELVFALMILLLVFGLGGSYDLAEMVLVKAFILAGAVVVYKCLKKLQ